MLLLTVANPGFHWMHAPVQLLLVVVLGYLAIRYINRPRITYRGRILRLRSPGAKFLVGHAALFTIRSRQYLLHWLAKLQASTYGEPIELYIPTLPPCVFISGALTAVFADVALFPKGRYFTEKSWDLFGDGIVNTDGKLWKIQRKVGRDFLSAANHSHLCNDVLPVVFQKSKKRLLQSRGQEVDLAHIVEEFSLGVMGHIAFGQDISIADPFVLAFDSASGAIAKRISNPFWKLLRMFGEGSFRQNTKVVHDFAVQLIRKRLDNGASLGLLDDLYQALGQNEQLASQAALNFLSAGRDTVAQAISWTLYELLKHPGHLHHIWDEVTTVLGPDGTHEALNLAVLNARHLPFTHAVVHEGLRLHPPVPLEIRQAQKSHVFSGSLKVPAQTLVLWSPYAFGRDPSIWGQDAPRFIPARWLDDSGRLLNPPPSEYPVFNGGPRICLGQNMAVSEAVYFIAALVLQPLTLELVEASDKETVNSLTMPLKDGLFVHVKYKIN